MNTHGPDLDRLARILGAPEVSWLVERVRKRAAEARPLTGTLTLSAATPAQRRAVDTLLGRAPSRGNSLTVRLEEIEAILRTSGIHPGGLRAAVEELTGPIPDNKANAHAEAQAWRHAHEPLDEAVEGNAFLEDWWTRPHTRGAFKRLAGGDAAAARTLASQTAAVLAALPADGISLPVLAARATGDAHALDADRPVGRLVLAATEQWAYSLSPNPEGLIVMPKSEQRRAQWAELGVSLDELSSRVLVLALPGNAAGPGSLGRLLAVAREHGEPLALTLRQINQGTATSEQASNSEREAANTEPDPFGVGRGEVFVCENPAVLEAAARQLGPACPPLLCVEGHLSAAARALLRALRERGARFRYHGDFDWGGVRIANSVFTLIDAAPWRYTFRDYLEAVDREQGAPLNTGEPCDASWDPHLRAAISARAVRVEEEHVLTELLADLGGHRYT
ncbi:TIGR02679 family protein [Actinospica sp.]|uniref:TIGR02679 family protein n=1 Tax=Actinospica sp. TaxID=1872142 RepID=UPI002B9CB5F8|nr:TIGR02679 family protein [Actinospica sp.]HWG22704.1 TIGR02679 family protein [Actinospica sp.]